MTKLKKNHIPNYISVFRIFLVPLYALLFFGVLSVGLDPMMAAGIVFILAGLSDALDGYLARKYNWITDMGKLLDPLADKLMEITVAVCLAVKMDGPFIILAAILITKEIIMIVGAYLIMSKSKVYVSAVWCGKLATLVWYVLLCVVHFFPNATGSLSNLLCIILILVMIMAFAMYIFNYAAQIQSTKDAILKEKKNH